MPHVLPELPYAFDALEPHIDAKTMEVHYTKHHRGYVDKLNAALENQPDLQEKPLAEILKDIQALPQTIRQAVINNGGGHANHSFFWPLMDPADKAEAPAGELAQALNETFGGIDAFKQEFTKAALGRFGSGWAWLVKDASGKLTITSTPNQDSPLTQNLTPVLGLDVWEHAYYLKYQNRRADYVKAWWNVLNWNAVVKNLKNDAGIGNI